MPTHSEEKREGLKDIAEGPDDGKEEFVEGEEYHGPSSEEREQTHKERLISIESHNAKIAKIMAESERLFGGAVVFNDRDSPDTIAARKKRL